VNTYRGDIVKTFKFNTRVMGCKTFSQSVTRFLHILNITFLTGDEVDNTFGITVNYVFEIECNAVSCTMKL